MMEGSGSGSVQIMTDPRRPKTEVSYGSASTTPEIILRDFFVYFGLFIF
jgi:hypothetical protein